MLGEAGDHCNHRSVFVIGQIEHLAECFLVFLLLFCHGCLVKVDKECLVGCRVVKFCVNAVDHAVKLESSFRQNAFKTITIEGVKDFGCVSFTDRCHHVACLDTAFHIVDAVAVDDQIVCPFRKSQNVGNNIRAVSALELNVVDCKHCLDALVSIIVAVEHVKENRCQCGVPVVGVEDVRIVVNKFQCFKDCL